MTPEELKQMRRKSGFTQAEFAANIGYEKRQVGKWELGQVPIPKNLVKLLKLAKFIVSLP